MCVGSTCRRHSIVLNYMYSCRESQCRLPPASFKSLGQLVVDSSEFEDVATLPASPTLPHTAQAEAEGVWPDGWWGPTRANNAGPMDAKEAAPMAYMASSDDLHSGRNGVHGLSGRLQRDSARSASDELAGSLRTSYLKTVLGSLHLKEPNRRSAVCAWYDATALSATASTNTETAGPTIASQASGEATAAVGVAERDADLAKLVTAEVASTLRYPLKLSRWRMIVRVVGILIISYVDIITDVLMLVQYSRSKSTEGAFVASAIFLSSGLLIHVLVAYLVNVGRGARAIAWEIVLAATFMAPAVATYRFVVGAEMGESAFLEPVFVYAMVKMVELVGETIPESVLQASVLLNADTADVTYLSIVSFAGSLLAAGALVADLNYTTESSRMKEQQTQGTHPLYGEFRHSIFYNRGTLPLPL